MNSTQDLGGLLRTAAASVDWRRARIGLAHCPVCDGTRPMANLGRGEMSVRCVGCRSSAVTMSVVSVLRARVRDLGGCSVYELSCRGAFHRFLSMNAGSLRCSEYFEDCPPGERREGIQCQDVQRLTLADESFDLCTSTEVFEHVPDDALGFAEIRRVLKPGGQFLFTVPLTGGEQTIEHLEPPVYHGDPAKGHGRVLAFRDYGFDIVERLTVRGFESTEILEPPDAIPWGFSRRVIVARKVA